MSINSGWELYIKAQSIIPGATQLFGKRSELYAPGLWPSYFKSAKGCTVYDLDNKSYLDFTMVGIGTSVLGYADPDINQAVISAIQDGNLTTLNAPVEVELATELLSIHPWADMVKYSRGGGEMLSVAVRIARAATGKGKVLFCGYHGWHDWFLSANLADKNSLSNHLLSDIPTVGLPKELIDTIFGFNFNDSEGFLSQYDKHKMDLAAIIIEPYRDNGPDPGFLHLLRECANAVGAVLIFDEVTSGFRECLGGMHLNQNVNPDLVIYGKAISNGFPMAALVGKGSVMSAAIETFISSTYWTDRIGPTAALATIQKQRRIQSGLSIKSTGVKIKSILENAASSNNLDINFSGLPSLLSFKLVVPDWPAVLTYYIQEMLERGFLASDRVYANLAHTDDKLHLFSVSCADIFKNISRLVELGEIHKHLKGPVKQMGIARVQK